MARRTIRARRASPYLLYLVIAFSLLTVAAAVGWGWMYSLKSQDEQNAFGRARVEAPGANVQDLWRAVTEGHIEKDSFYDEKGADLFDMTLAQKDLAEKYRFEITQLSQRLTGDDFATQRGLSHEDLRAVCAVASLTDLDRDSIAAAITKLSEDRPVAARRAYHGPRQAGDTIKPATDGQRGLICKLVSECVVAGEQPHVLDARLWSEFRYKPFCPMTTFTASQIIQALLAWKSNRQRAIMRERISDGLGSIQQAGVRPARPDLRHNSRHAGGDGQCAASDLPCVARARETPSGGCAAGGPGLLGGHLRQGAHADLGDPGCPAAESPGLSSPAVTGSPARTHNSALATSPEPVPF
jgi:hypothetical protein